MAVLLLRQADLWEVTLSLNHLSQRAGWVVLSVKLLVGHHADESFTGGFNHEGLEKDLLYLLRAHSAVARDSAAEAMAEEAAAAATTAGTIVKAEEVKVEVGNAPRAKEPPTKLKAKRRIFTLRHVAAVCQHIALSAAMRLFYVQGVDLSRGLWRGILESEFLDDMDASRSTVRFWRCAFTDRYQFQARIVQPRTAKDGSAAQPNAGLGRPLLAQLHCLVLSTVESVPDSLHEVPFFDSVPELLIQQYIVGGGVTFRRYFDAVLYSLSQCKLVLLRARLLLDAAVNGAIASGLLQLNHDAIGITLAMSDASVRFCIDAQTGNYVTQTLSGSSPALAAGVARFLAEINNLETQRAVRDLLGERGVEAFIRDIGANASVVQGRVLTLATANALLQYMALASIEKALLHGKGCPGIVDAGSLLPTSLLSKAEVPTTDSAMSVLHVRGYSSLALLQKRRPKLKLHVAPVPVPLASDALAATSVSAIDIGLPTNAEALYKNGHADMGLFIVLRSDSHLSIYAHVILVELKAQEPAGPVRTDGGIALSRKKSKPNKPLTAGQLAALRSKEAEEESAHQAAQLAEQHSNVSRAGSADVRLVFQLLQWEQVPRWAVAIGTAATARAAAVAQLLAAMHSKDTQWVRRPIPPASLAIPADKLHCSAGGAAVVVSVDDVRACYALRYTFQSKAQEPMLIAHIGYLPTKSEGSLEVPLVIPLLLGVEGGSTVCSGVPAAKATDGGGSSFYALAHEMLHRAINMHAAGPMAAAQSLPLLLATTLPQLHLLWACLQRLQNWTAPIPSSVQTVTSGDESIAMARGRKSSTPSDAKTINSIASLRATWFPTYLMKPIGVGSVGSADCYVQYSVHLRSYVDDGMGAIKLHREECAGLVNAHVYPTNGELGAAELRFESPIQGGSLPVVWAKTSDVMESLDILAQKLVRNFGLDDSM